MDVNVNLLDAFNEYVKVLCGDSYKQEFVKFKLGPEEIVLRFEPTSGDIDANRAKQQVQCMVLCFDYIINPVGKILYGYSESIVRSELNTAGKRNENGDLIPPFFELHVPRNALAQRRAIKLIGQARALLETSCK